MNLKSEVKSKLLVETNILIMSVSSEDNGNYRKLSEKKFSILLIKRDKAPFKDMWSLPGGFVEANESLEESARRILKNETNLSDIYIEQLYTYGDVNRYPDERVISTAYMALVDKNRLTNKLSSNASWFNVFTLEDKTSYYVTLDNASAQIKFTIKKKLRDKSTDRYDFIVDKNESLAFDHPRIIVSGLERLKNKINYTDIVFNMMPEYFTLGELQQVYEVILGKKLLDPAFRRIISNKVEKTSKVQTGGGHRPSALFKYKTRK